MTGALRVEGRRVAIEDGDTIASAMYRDGIRTFTRSLKYHRRRGLYCLSGDCPNCLVTVDGQPGVRACVTPAREGQDVRRASGWPSTEHDALHVTDRLHRLMPVALLLEDLHPAAVRVAARRAGDPPGDGHRPAAGRVRGRREAGARRARRRAGRGRRGRRPRGGGRGGGRRTRRRCSSRSTGSASARADAGVARTDRRARAPRRARPARRSSNATRPSALYAGPFVPVVGPDEVLHIEAGRVIAATGAVEIHAVFPGNDLPGVFLARGAARLAGVHGVAPGRRAVVVTSTEEGAAAAEILRAAGTEVAEVVRDAVVVRAEGSRRVEGVMIGSGADRRTDRLRHARAVARVVAARRPAPHGHRGRGRRRRRRRPSRVLDRGGRGERTAGGRWRA